jgi:hypothetical protein
LSGAIAKLASINLRKLVLSPTGSINLGFKLREERGFLQGESLASNLFTLLLFCFILFLLASFYQKYKKN